MTLAVSAAQQRSWEHLLVLEVQETLRTSDEEALKEKVADIIQTRGLMTNFLPMPFTEGSADGKKLTAVLLALREQYPASAVLQKFYWKFWRPLADSVEATYVATQGGGEVVHVGARVA